MDYEFGDLNRHMEIKLEPDSPPSSGLPSPVLGGIYHNLDNNRKTTLSSYVNDHVDVAGDVSCDSSSPNSEEQQDFLSNSWSQSSISLSSEVEVTDQGPKRLCLVCGDIASGYHYGVASCEACKAFFKRTIQGNIEYSCPAQGNCEITKRRRKACQACRFQKCLRMGMLKEGVRLDRVRGGRQKYKRNDAYSFSVSHIPAVRKQSSTESKSHMYNKMLNSLVNIEPDKVFAMPDPNLPEDDYKLMATLSDLADRELVATIGWAKQVPGFISIPLPDQMNLLQSTWLDILCFNLAYRSVPYKGMLVFADDFKCSEDDSLKYSSHTEVDMMARRLAKKMTDLNVTREEYMLMKSMLLVNPDVNVDNPDYVQTLRDKIQDSLLEYQKSRGMNSQRRLGNLLFCLPLLMHQKLLCREYWFAVKKSGQVPLHKLLSEMLEYYCS